MATNIVWDRYQEPDRVSSTRILAIASAICIHVAAFLLLLLPMSGIQLEAAGPDTIKVVWVLPKEITPPPPPPPDPDPLPVVQRQPQPVVVPRPVVPPRPATPAPILVDEARANDLPPAPISPPGPVSIEPANPGPVSPPARQAQEGVVVLVSPKPPYPVAALRSHIEGTVILLIIVDAAGNPEKVTVSRSSGNRDLDRAAREHVASKWKFQGTGVQQTAKLPIDFHLN